MAMRNNGIKEVNLTLNGNSCNGYPIRSQNDFPIWSYYKFLDVIGRLQNSNNGQQLTIGEFKRNMIIAHKFEGEDSPQGWLGATIALTEPAGFKTSHTLVIWTVNNTKTTIDKFNMIEKYNL